MDKIILAEQLLEQIAKEGYKDFGLLTKMLTTMIKDFKAGCHEVCIHMIDDIRIALEKLFQHRVSYSKPANGVYVPHKFSCDEYNNHYRVKHAETAKVSS